LTGTRPSVSRVTTMAVPRVMALRSRESTPSTCRAAAGPASHAGFDDVAPRRLPGRQPGAPYQTTSPERRGRARASPAARPPPKPWPLEPMAPARSAAYRPAGQRHNRRSAG
jgi:hypothetical protein